VTQADVARLADVSQATVSLVLAGEQDERARVGHDTRQRVLDAIRVTGYAPDPAAQRLAKGSNSIVGVFTYEAVFPHTSHDFYQPFLLGIEAEAENLGCDLLLFTSAPAVEGRRHLFGDKWSRLGITDGCLLLGRHVDRDELAKLMDGGVPFVFLGRRETSAGVPPYVGADYVGATGNLVQVMIDHQHTRIGLLSDLGADESYRDRVAGYRAAMADAGLRPVIIDHTEVTADDAVDLIEANALTAVLVGVGHLAEEIRVAAEHRGIAVPRDLSLAVLGQPERPLTDEIAWSGFRLPREEMGAEAMRLLARLIGGEQLGDDDLARVLPCTLDVGETIATAPGTKGAPVTRPTRVDT
jgi:DNA-binding LacI/PurR family transcriptional regulator